MESHIHTAQTLTVMEPNFLGKLAFQFFQCQVLASPGFSNRRCGGARISCSPCVMYCNSSSFCVCLQIKSTNDVWSKSHTSSRLFQV